MMKTRVFIVRHTETIGNVEKRLTGRQDYEITERGQVLIQKLTKELEKIKFDRAYSSTSRRAIKTIEPIVVKQTQNEINEIVGIPGQESMEETAKRMYNYIFKIVKENEGKTILISSHGVAIEAFLRKIENIKFRYEREKFCQYNVAINELEFKNDKFKIIRLADINYLNK